MDNPSLECQAPISSQSESSDADESDALCKPIVTVESPEKALRSSKIQIQQQYRPDAYELSYWTDASLPGPRTRMRLGDHPALRQGLCSFCVVHHRWDVQIPKPGEPNWDTTWWLSGFVATGVVHPWQAEAMAVIQALRMAVDHCERASGTIVTPGRPLSSLKRISAGIPLRVNIFSDHPKVLQSLGGMSTSDDRRQNQWLVQSAKELITLLGTFRVGVSLRWIPGHCGDQCNSLAHEGSRMALHLRTRYQKVWSKRLHRVMLKVRSIK